jgi:hypothetical protein
MKFFKLRTACATLVIVILTACGGENMNTTNASHPDQLAASAGSGGAPLPDCAPEACEQPRIIDGLAEEFRAAAQLRSAQADDAAETAPAAPLAPAAGDAAAPAVLTQ